MQIKGSIVAIVTPMQADNQIDFQAFEQLIEWHIQQGTDGIVVLGTTGESPTIDASERTALIKSAVDKVAGRVPIIVGTGANVTATSIVMSQEAQALGADACLTVAPYYNKPPQEGMYQHFKAIADAIDIPVILYNVPARTVADILPDTVARLSKIDNIIAIKEATGDLARLQELKEKCESDFVYFCGTDPINVDFMLQGGHGVISVTANMAPKLMHEVCEAALQNDAAQAKQLDKALADLHEKIGIQTNPIPTKWALNNMRLIPAGIRLPLVPLAQEFHQDVQQALKTAGVFSE